MDPISKHFTSHEALFLPSWNREATESDGLDDSVRTNLKDLFSRMDQVRDHFNKPIRVHCAYRPEEYNKLVHGAANSAHKYGQACDFDVEGMSCDDVRAEILKSGMLESLNMRMEDNGAGAPWIHLDTRAVPAGHNRYFKP